MSKERELLKKVVNHMWQGELVLEDGMNKEINDLKQQIMWLQNQNASLINRQEALRDHFAGLAMQTLPKEIPDMETLARLSYNMADAMLAERDNNDN